MLSSKGVKYIARLHLLGANSQVQAVFRPSCKTLQYPEVINAIQKPSLQSKIERQARRGFEAINLFWVEGWMSEGMVVRGQSREAGKTPDGSKKDLQICLRALMLRPS